MLCAYSLCFYFVFKRVLSRPLSRSVTRSMLLVIAQETIDENVASAHSTTPLARCSGQPHARIPPFVQNGTVTLPSRRAAPAPQPM